MIFVVLMNDIYKTEANYFEKMLLFLEFVVSVLETAISSSFSSVTKVNS